MTQSGKGASQDPLGALLGALLGGNPAVQERMQNSGQSLEEVLGSLSGDAATPQPPDAPGGEVLGRLSDSALPADQNSSSPIETPQAGSPSGDVPRGPLGRGSVAIGGSPSQGGEADALGSILGGLLGGAGAPPGGMPSQDAREDTLGSILGGLLGGAGSQSGGMPSQSTGADPLGSILGGLLGGVTPSSGRGSAQGMPAGGDPLGAILGGLLGGGGATGALGAIAGNPLQNAFTGPIADAISKKTGIPREIAQTVVMFALNSLMSNMGQGADDRRGLVASQLVDTISSGKPPSQKLLKSSGLVTELSEQTGLDPKTATKSLQQAFQALGTQMGEGTMSEHQAQFQSLLKKWE